MDGLLVYTRHEGAPGYDDVVWIPADGIDSDAARGLALLKLQSDSGSLSVQVISDSGEVVTVARAA